MADYLGEFEQLILLALARLGEDAYGVSIRATLIERTKRRPSFGAIYSTLRRMEDKGLVRSFAGAPEAVRGGRAKKHVVLRPEAAPHFAKRTRRSYGWRRESRSDERPLDFCSASFSAWAARMTIVCRCWAISRKNTALGSHTAADDSRPSRGTRQKSFVHLPGDCVTPSRVAPSHLPRRTRDASRPRRCVLSWPDIKLSLRLLIGTRA